MIGTRLKITRQLISLRSSQSSQSSSNTQTTTNNNNNNKNLFTLIGLDGKRLLEFPSLDKAKASIESNPSLNVIQVDKNKNIWKIIPSQSSQSNQSSQNSQSSQNTTTNTLNTNNTKKRSEKEFKLSNVTCENDLMVKVKKMETVLKKGHNVRVILQQKKGSKFSLYSPVHDHSILDKVRKHLIHVSSTTGSGSGGSISHLSDGTQLLILNSIQNSQSSQSSQSISQSSSIISGKK